MPDLVKLALAPSTLAAMTRSLKGFGAGAGMGGLVGGLGGAAIGAGHGYLKQRHEGATPLGAVSGTLSGALSGAGKVVLLGAGLGGLAGAARPALAESLSGVKKLQGASHFGQRQVHALTGVGDANYVRSIGAGATNAENRMNAAQRAWETAKGTPAAGEANDELFKSLKGFEAASESERRGLTSIPGYVKSLAKDPMGTLRSGFREQWHGGGMKTKALMYGLPAATAVTDLAHGKADEQGRGRFERVGRDVGMLSGLAAPLPITGDLVASGVLSGAFGRIGRGVDHALTRKPRALAPGMSVSNPEPAGSAQAAEHILSDRAAGVIPESLT